MPLYTEKLTGPAYSADDIEYGLGDVLGAQASETFLDSPIWSIAPRAVELDTARRRYGGAYQNFDRVGAEGWLAKRGLTLQDLPLEDRSYNELELSILTRRKIAEIRRNQVLQRGAGGAGEAIARLGTAIGVSLLDPLNLASGFIPVVGEARYARILAQAGGAGGRAAVRAGVGAVEGAAGAAIMEPLVAGARRQELADYTLADSLANIAFGGLFGGGLHTVGGAIGDALRPPQRASQPIIEQAASRVREAPAAAPAQAGAAAVPVPPVPRPAVPDAYFDDAVTLRRALVAARDVDVNDPDALAKVLGSRPKPISQFVRETGGIFDGGGELAARDVNGRTVPGLVRKDGGRENSATVDAVRQRVFDAGYFPEKADYNQISDSELFDAIAEDVNGRRRYPQSAEAAVTRVKADRDFVEALAQQGITRDMDEGQIAARLREIDEEARAQSAEAAGIDPETLAEYDRSAARQVAEAEEVQRGQALRAAVGQALGDDPIEVRPVFGGDPRQAADRLADPDAHRSADPAAVALADAATNEGDVLDAAALQRQVADLDDQLRTMADDAELEGEAGEGLRAALEAADEAIAPLEQQTRELTKAARLMGVCAARHAA